MITIVIVLFFQIVIAEPIKFVLISIDYACWPGKMPNFKPCKPDDDENYNRLDFLKQRLKSLRVQMLITERYRDVTLNEKYKSITQDLFVYGRCLIVLSCLVLVTRDELLYHNTEALQILFMENHTDYIGLGTIVHLNQLLDFVESSLVSAFDFGSDEGGANYWIHSEGTKMLGVVRLRQLRLINEKFGWGKPEFSNVKYMPDWELPYRRLHYTDKYWRIYDPWLPISDSFDFTDAILMNFEHVGQFQNYPELKGYVTMLARSKQNSMKILDFLSEYHWLTFNTSAVFLDFTLYNVDANIFSVCTLRVEQTPFGSAIPDIDCDSVKLIEELEQLPYMDIIVLIIYIVVVLQFTQSFICTVWYEPSKMKSIWYKMDLIIIVLNILVMILIAVRATLVQGMLKRLEGANKLEYLNFRAPSRLHSLTTILIGFLICLMTLRVWKILQFSKVFQLFTQTFALAWKALAITMIMILIILMAFGIAFATINGNNSAHFIRLLTSIITALCFSFGFSSEIKPQEVFHGGEFFGMFMYASLGFVVSVLLINFFIITISEFFSTARAERDAKTKRRISFFEFLRVEYNDFISFFLKLSCFRKGYKRNNRTVAENIERIVEHRIAQDIERKAELRKKRSILSASTQKPPPPKDEETLQAEYRERIEHILAISSIMKTQIEILKHLLFSNKSMKKQKSSKNDDDNPYLDDDLNMDEDEESDDQTTEQKDNTKKDENEV
ncbi:polycystin-2-like [Drosophila innubila]|uniref:polycystin-2-like n=1 Tax=Drosophila innubila TaxID=198719 RepID=UPI00148C74C0|nr:polycystin-2-like [Drosophila innubila]